MKYRVAYYPNESPYSYAVQRKLGRFGAWLTVRFFSTEDEAYQYKEDVR